MALRAILQCPQLNISYVVPMLMKALVTTCLGLTAVTATPTVTASLDYGSFEGFYPPVCSIGYWTKILFAALPTGEYMFGAPQPPIAITYGIYNLSQSYDFCPQRSVNGTEDCHYLGLFSRPWNPPQALRPVVVVYYGGAFKEGGGSFSLPPVATTHSTSHHATTLSSSTLITASTLLASYWEKRSP